MTVKPNVADAMDASKAATGASTQPLVSLDSAIFKDVRVALQARVGQATLSVQDLLALKSGDILKLDLKVNEPIELLLNSALVARGEIVAVDDHFAIRIVEIASAS